MGRSLTQLRQSVRYLMGDTNALAYNFPDLQVDDWINQAIRELSGHFPRSIEYTIDTVAGQRVYELEVEHSAILSVEYNQGNEDPPIYLQRRPYVHSRFWLEEGYYDFVKPSDSDTDNPPLLYISTIPTADDLIIAINLQTEHNPLTTGSDQTTLPDRFAFLIPLHVRWQAWMELATTEGMDPGPLATLSYSQEMNAGRAERMYRTALKQAQEIEAESGTASWSMDKFDRRY